MWHHLQTAILPNKIICSTKTEPKVAKKFKTILSISIQIWLSNNYKISIHQNSRMQQVLIQIQIQVHIHIWLFFGHAKDMEIYFLQQGWIRVVEMTESEREK